METDTRGFTAVMAQRREPPDALDFFPTPLWGSRALFRHVLPFLGIDAIGSAWEPACGEGHMAAVIRESYRLMSLPRTSSTTASEKRRMIS